MSDTRAEAMAVLALIPLTLGVALWNGFPIIFYDTGAYLLEGLGRVFLAERSPVYSLLLDFGGARTSLWLIALLQAAATAFVMVETVRAVAPRMNLAAMIGLGIGLVLLTGLPWYVGQIEPDCFAAIAVLSIYLLAFHAEAGLADMAAARDRHTRGRGASVTSAAGGGAFGRHRYLSRGSVLRENGRLAERADDRALCGCSFSASR